MTLLEEELTQEIIGAFYKVYNTLGFGFLESVYEKAMLIELKKLDLECYAQYHLPVYYEGEQIGNFFADIIVENKVILELKSSPLAKEHSLQLYNYLKATDIEIGLLLSFGKEPKVERKILTNNLKGRRP
jgi:GxxExxY protein